MGGGWAERDVGSLGLANLLLAGFLLRITITIRTISISICVIGKVKVHLISHTFWECRGRFYSLSKQRGRFCQKRLLASPSFFTCTFLMDLISWYILPSLCGETHICKKTNWNNDEKHAVTFSIQKLFYNLDVINYIKSHYIIVEICKQSIRNKIKKTVLEIFLYR